jgi:hypothetical protein
MSQETLTGVIFDPQYEIPFVATKLKSESCVQAHKKPRRHNYTPVILKHLGQKRPQAVQKLKMGPFLPVVSTHSTPIQSKSQESDEIRVL